MAETVEVLTVVAAINTSSATMGSSTTQLLLPDQLA